MSLTIPVDGFVALDCWVNLRNWTILGLRLILDTLHRWNFKHGGTAGVHMLNYLH